MAAFACSKDWPVWILFSARPVSMALFKWWGRMAVIILAMVHAGELLLSLGAVADIRTLRAKHVRIIKSGEVLHRAEANAKTEITLLIDGCPAIRKRRFPDGGRDGEGSILSFSFDHEMNFNGWIIEPVLAAKGAWLEVSSSSDRALASIKTPPWTRRGHNGGPEDAMLGQVDLRPSWRWLLQDCCCKAGLALGYIIAASLTGGGQVRRGAAACAFTYAACGCLSLVAAAVTFFESAGESAARTVAVVASAVYTILYMIYAALLWTERLLPEVAPIISVLFAATIAYDSQAHFPNTSSSFAKIGQRMHLGWVAVTVCGCLAMLCTRRAVRRWVFGHLVVVDRHVMDAAWDHVLAQPSNRHALQKLARWASSMTARLVLAANARQGLPQPAAPGMIKRFQAIASLEQLYRQAAALDPVLRDIAHGLAQAWKGSLPEPESCFSGGLKPTERALEKLLRCYDCAVQRLLDCCRQVQQSCSLLVSCWSYLRYFLQ